jgi:hypothetical protein
MDFMNSAGVLLPMELCGREVLYSCLNASHFTRASASDKNQFWSMHSARTLPLNVSTKLLSVGLPGREKSSVTPTLVVRDSSRCPQSRVMLRRSVALR